MIILKRTSGFNDTDVVNIPSSSLIPFSRPPTLNVFPITEGRCLLELTHRSNTEGQDHWLPIAKKVYWPPPGPVRAESSPSVHSGKTLFLDL